MWVSGQFGPFLRSLVLLGAAFWPAFGSGLPIRGSGPLALKCGTWHRSARQFLRYVGTRFGCFARFPVGVARFGGGLEVWFSCQRSGPGPASQAQSQSWSVLAAVSSSWPPLPLVLRLFEGSVGPIIDLAGPMAAIIAHPRATFGPLADGCRR